MDERTVNAEMEPAEQPVLRHAAAVGAVCQDFGLFGPARGRDGVDPPALPALADTVLHRDRRPQNDAGRSYRAPTPRTSLASTCSFTITRDARGSLVHVRRRGDGECVGCIEAGLYDVLRSLIREEVVREAATAGGDRREGGSR
jgi:hypothetical protein